MKIILNFPDEAVDRIITGIKLDRKIEIKDKKGFITFHLMRVLADLVNQLPTKEVLKND